MNRAKHSGHSSSSVIERLDALYEYDREPVEKTKLHGWSNFLAMYAGEHVAGTEFILGPLMVLHGVSASDFFIGLFIGNVLAVLSWALITAPVAVKTRLTLYWQLRKICGPYLTIAYSTIFAMVLCLLAGSMVTVSVTAFSIPLDIPNPDYAAGDRFPTIPWILLAIFVGTVIATIAVLGFNKIAHFAKICAPWMILVFFAAGLAVLPDLGVNDLSDFWRVVNEKVFTGEPVVGNTKYGIWHVIGFAWLCNAPGHLGMSDMTIFRYAKSWKQGFSSAVGMFLGHYMAWIASGILCAAFLADGFSNPQPGNIALFGAGYAGLVCVIIAGWTTANPTLYRAGLAIQVVTPNWKRWKVTFLAGFLMIITACIPAINASLDRFLGYFGLMFIPLGAIIFTDVWIFPKLGLESNYVEKKKILFSWPVLLSWISAFLLVMFFYAKDSFQWFSELIGNQPKWLDAIKVDLLFMAAPEWILAVIFYITLSTVQQKKNKPD